MSHTEISEITAPRSQFYQGPYGRMFRNLPPWEPEGDTEDEKIASIQELAASNIRNDENPEDKDLDNPRLPAGYTYLAQFIAHDITFDSISSLQRANDVDRLRNFRTPRFDLDSMYGRGPKDQPYLYTKTIPGQLNLHFNSVGNYSDLWRSEDGTAIIGDPRNDENIIISQMLFAFIQFHNTEIADQATFEEAQRSTRWHYQWVVIHDFLKRLCGKKMVDGLLTSSGQPGKPNLNFYKYKNKPFIPVEFSAGAFRFGHSMVRSSYHLNKKLKKIRKRTKEQEEDVPLKIFDPNERRIGENSLVTRLSRPLPPCWMVQWDMFVEYDGSKPQLSRRIDKWLSTQLNDLPFLTSNKSLVYRDLLRGWRLGLPSGQSVAKRMGIEPLESLNENDDPLWLYVLREAEVKGKRGKRLGPVGARIVAEVLIGLLAGDPHSFYSIEPHWAPLAVCKGNKYELSDFLAHGDVPMTYKQIRDITESEKCEPDESL